jgi:hypothetical protein
VKGFSEDPNEFIRGFAQVEMIMKLLFVDKLLLWPRFHVDVAQDLDTKIPDALDVYADMSSAQQSIENAIVAVISATIEEIKRCNLSVRINLSISHIISSIYLILQLKIVTLSRLIGLLRIN